MNIVTIFIILQVVLLFVMTFHDWVHLPPLTDIRELEKYSTKKGRVINSLIFFLLVCIPLLLTTLYQPELFLCVKITIISMYGLLTFGTVFAWWIPYFFGSSEKHKNDFIEYRTTHHFLPKRGDNIVPNTFHVLLHLLIWSCFVLSTYVSFVTKS